jgi:hypothetical protein
METREILFNDFCKSKYCPNYIEWEYYGQPLFSCKKIGEREDINEYPEDCDFLDEIKVFNPELK